MHLPSLRTMAGAATALLATICRLPSVTALLPLNHLSRPSPLWNQAIQSPLGRGNSVAISPDDRWLYVTSADGSLSKLDPRAGDFHDTFLPPRRNDDGAGGQIPPDAPSQWVTQGLGGISFYMEGSPSDWFLVYWVFDSPPVGTGLRPSSRVIAVRHDPSENIEARKIEVLWIRVIDGIIVGDPAIGSEGKFVYFTMNSTPAPPATESPTASPVTVSPTAAPVSKAPTESPVESSAAAAILAAATATDAPTKSPVVAPVPAFFTIPPTDGAFNRSGSDSESNNAGSAEAAAKPEFWWLEEADGVFACAKNSKYPDDYPTNEIAGLVLFSTYKECCEQNNPNAECDEPLRRLEAGGGERRPRRTTQENSGYFVILSHPLNGEIVYRFESRSVLSIQHHHFAPLEIAHNPQRGNYNGGQGNRNDVVVWGSLPDGNDGGQGETVLFQLPRGFNFTKTPVDTGGFSVRVLESVPWTTRTKPTLSSDGMELYFAIGGNRLTGWNNGKEFDVVYNLGPAPLPGGVESGYAARPFVLAEDDQTLLVTDPDNTLLSAMDSETAGNLWVLSTAGTDPFTTPRISPDGTVAYFGKQNSVHAVDLVNPPTNNSPDLLWGEDGYSSGGSPDEPMLADVSVSSTGEFLYYNGYGMVVSAIRVADAVPTQSPTSSPTPAPSAVPTASPVASPTSAPTTTLPPTSSSSPTVDPFRPSESPTTTLRPSASVPTTGSPIAGTAEASDAPTSPPTSPPTSGAPPTPSPVEEAMAEEPTPNPTRTPPEPVDPPPSPPSAAGSTIPDDSNKESPAALSQTAIIGIAVGAGAGLLLICCIILYVRKRKGSEDDGLDTDWAAPDDGGGEEGTGTRFTYGSSADEESRQRGGQQGDLQW